MIVHLFNSSSVSGPERLVLPALARSPGRFLVVNLLEERIPGLRESDPLRRYSRSLGLAYEAVPVWSRWDPEAVAVLRGLLERLRPELVHAHDVKASLALLAAGRRRSSPGFPRVSTHHGVLGRPDWRTRAYEWVYRRLLNRFDRVLAVSSADHGFLADSGIARDRLRLHLNGADARRVLPAEREAESARIRALWGEDRRPFLMGMVGRLSAEKDHARLLRVLSRLDRMPAPEWRCLVFGAGPLEAPLRARARALALDRRVRWMGYRKEAGDEMAGLDLLLSFSKAEGLPISLIEAGHAGTPVLATKVGGVADIVPNESFGGWVDPGEPAEETARRIARLMSPEGRAALRGRGEKSREYAEKHFSAAAWTARLEGIYSELGVGIGGTEAARTPLPAVRKGGRDAVAV